MLKKIVSCLEKVQILSLLQIISFFTTLTKFNINRKILVQPPAVARKNGVDLQDESIPLGKPSGLEKKNNTKKPNNLALAHG